jgi:hypothetical protein
MDPIVLDCGCCEPTTTVAEMRIRPGHKIKYGFPKLDARPVAGRYIATGWSGVVPGVSAAAWPWVDPVMVSAFGLSLPLNFHAAGAVVKYRTGPATVTTYTAIRDTYSSPPSADWTPGGAEADAVNTWVAAGFWAEGSGNFAAGDFVYSVVRSADELTTDWCIRAYECIGGVTTSGDPVLDGAHWREWLGGQGTMRTMLTVDTKDTRPLPQSGVMVPGDLYFLAETAAPWSSPFWRARVAEAYSVPSLAGPSVPSYLDQSKWVQVAANRGLFDERFTSNTLAMPDCRGEGPWMQRWLAMEAVTTVSGRTPVTESWTHDRLTGARSHEGSGALVWGDVGTLPTVSGVVASATLAADYTPATGLFLSHTPVWTPPGTFTRGQQFDLTLTVSVAGVPTYTEVYTFTCIARSCAAPALNGGFWGTIGAATREEFRAAFSVVGSHTGPVGTVADFVEGAVTFEAVENVGGEFPNWPAHHAKRLDGAAILPRNIGYGAPTIYSARLAGMDRTETTHALTWDVLAAAWSLIIKIDGAAATWEDQLEQFTVEQSVALADEYLDANVRADLVWDVWRAGDAIATWVAGTELRWGMIDAGLLFDGSRLSVNFTTAANAVLVPLGWRCPRLLASEAIYSNLGSWCERHSLCGVVTCQDRTSPTFAPKIEDTAFGEQVRATNNCTCAP